MKLIVDNQELKSVIVIWIDALHEDGDCKKENFVGIVESYTSGWYVSENILFNLPYISIAMEYFPSTNEWRKILHIPKCLIKNIIGLS